MKKLLLSILLLISISAFAEYPDKPVRIIVPIGPGGGNDLVTRIIAQKLSTIWKVNVIVENKPGGNAIIGSSLVAKSDPDGYTLLSMALSQIASSSAMLNNKSLFNWETDLAPVGILGHIPPFVVAISAKRNIKSLKELKDYGKLHDLTYGTIGDGSPYHIYGEIVSSAMQVTGIPVPYKAAPQAMFDLLNGSVDIIICPETQVLQYIDSKEIVALAIVGSTYSQNLPSVPTTHSLGYNLPNLPQTYNLFAPSHTPVDIQKKISKGVEQAIDMARPELLERKLIDGGRPIPTDVTRFSINQGKEWVKQTERVLNK